MKSKRRRAAGQRKTAGLAKRMAAAVLTGAFCAGIWVFPVWADNDTIESLREQIDQAEDLKKATEDAKDATEDNIDNLGEARTSLQGQLDGLTQDLTAISQNLEEIESDIIDKNEEIRQAQEELEEAKATEEAQYEAMKKRLRYLYEDHNQTYFEILANSRGFSDLLNQSLYIEKLHEYDRNMLVRYQETKEAVEQYRNQLEEERAEQEVMQLEYEAQQDNLESTIASTRTEIANFDEQLARARQEAAEYVRVIEARNAEIRAAEEAARREEESRRAAEASRAAEEAKRNEAKGPGATQAPKKSSGGTAQGREVADYALQFVGNPYVYGGTSLTNGADCSGFVQSVYKHFGISVPRTSGEQRSAGVGVSYSEAQPGDIICYAGHVGIYIGNGQIVHASSARTGIKVSNATYRSILAVRRVL